MSEITTAAFLNKGNKAQFKYILSLYDEALRLKASSKGLKKPEEMIKLDEWFQVQFPKMIKSRKDSFITHEELVNVIKWKLARGKFRPRLKELVTMNSPRVVETESKKAFRALFKKDDLGSAINYLCNLKGIGPATASAILTAANPAKAAFMADEVLNAIPEIEGIDYTVQEYLEMLRIINDAKNRLGNIFTPHEIELALWTHNVLLQFKPNLLADIPDGVEDEDSTDNLECNIEVVPEDESSCSHLETEETENSDNLLENSSSNENFILQNNFVSSLETSCPQVVLTTDSINGKRNFEFLNEQPPGGVGEEKNGGGGGEFPPDEKKFKLTDL